MKKTKRPAHFKRDCFTYNVFDNAEMRVIARFPFDRTSILDQCCASIRAEMFVKMYAERLDFPFEQFSIINVLDNSVHPVK